MHNSVDKMNPPKIFIQITENSHCKSSNQTVYFSLIIIMFLIIIKN